MTNRHVALGIQQLRGMLRLIILWSAVWLLLSLLFATVFKSLSTSSAQSARIFESLPPAVLKTVNIPVDYFSTPEKFLSGQFLTVYLLAGSVMAITTAAYMIGGRIADKTIVGSLTKDLSRPAIYVISFMTFFVSLAVMNSLVGMWLYGAFSLFSGATISPVYVASMAAGATIVFGAFAALGQLLGTALRYTIAPNIGYAMAVISFFLNGLGALAGVPAWIQECSVYYYLDAPHLGSTGTLGRGILVPALVAIAMCLIGAIVFRRKDVHV